MQVSRYLMSVAAQKVSGQLQRSPITAAFIQRRLLIGYLDLSFIVVTTLKHDFRACSNWSAGFWVDRLLLNYASISCTDLEFYWILCLLCSHPHLVHPFSQCACVCGACPMLGPKSS